MMDEQQISDLFAKQNLAFIALIEVLVHSMSESKSISETAFKANLERILALPSARDNSQMTAMFEHITYFLNVRDGNDKPHWLRGVIAGGKADGIDVHPVQGHVVDRATPDDKVVS